MFRSYDGVLQIGNSQMDYVTFGKGEKQLVILPGLSDGIKTVKGTSLILSITNRLLAKHFQVYVFSRKNSLPRGYSIDDMARDQVEAMKRLNINKPSLIGISQGGMISLAIATHFPEMVDKLVLVNTTAGNNEIVRRVIGNWIKWAKKGDFKQLTVDSLLKNYSQKKNRKLSKLYPMLTPFFKPKNIERFLIQAQACVDFDVTKKLQDISMKTLIIGGNQDEVMGKSAARELHDGISDSQLIIYKECGHSAWDEAKTCKKDILYFLENADM